MDEKNNDEKKDEKDESTDDYDQIKNTIEELALDHERVDAYARENLHHLVFEGGGMRALAFGGVMKLMEEHDLMKYVQKLAGSSAGAIFAAGIAVGYSAQEMIEIMTQTDFNSFKDSSTIVVLDLVRLLTQYGIYKGDAFFKWISKILAKKTGDAKITFKQIFERYGKTLVITGTCLNRATTYFFCHENPVYADMPVALAVRISMSIPCYWKAVKLGKDTMVDGGVLNNYPLYVFDGRYIGDPKISDEAIQKSKTIGFKLMMSDEKRDSTLYHINDEIDGPIEFTKAFINAMLIQIERGHIRSGYWDRTVCINTHNVTSLDFSLSAEQKALLVHEGYIASKNFFHCKLEGKENDMNRAITRF